MKLTKLLSYSFKYLFNLLMRKLTKRINTVSVNPSWKYCTLCWRYGVSCGRATMAFGTMLLTTFGHVDTEKPPAQRQIISDIAEVNTSICRSYEGFSKLQSEKIMNRKKLWYYYRSFNNVLFKNILFTKLFL